MGVTFTGEDAGSGIESCSSLTYSGPDNASAQVTGTCRDKAGHDSAPKAFRLKYDATPPSLSTVIAKVGRPEHGIVVLQMDVLAVLLEGEHQRLQCIVEGDHACVLGIRARRPGLDDDAGGGAAFDDAQGEVHEALRRGGELVVLM